MTSESSDRITRATAKKNLEEKAAKVELLEKSNERSTVGIRPRARTSKQYKAHFRTGKRQIVCGTSRSKSSHRTGSEGSYQTQLDKAHFAIHTIRNRIHSFAS